MSARSAKAFKAMVPFQDNLLYRTEKLLTEVRFFSALKLVSQEVETSSVIFDIIYPLLTRTRRIRWSDLDPQGSSGRSTVLALQALILIFEDCVPWSKVQIAAGAQKFRNCAGGLPAVDLLYRCVLFSEYRLPLFESMEYLGVDECVSRLTYVCGNLMEMNLVG
jgi:hypothetical protein